MGRIIQSNNGKTTIHTTGENISEITPEANTYVLGVDLVSGLYEKLDPNGTVISLEGGGVAGGGITAVTYSEIYNGLTANSLSQGMFYEIADFQTCYDQPDFDYYNNAITTGNYKQGPVEPIIVFATSSNTISTTAYQPAYPNDTIKYDWSWNTTEVTTGVAFGRITERIDEFNNRTDYDHRNILFRRYDNYYYGEKDIAKGTIELIQNTGEVIGIGTEFSNYNTGDHIAIPNSSVLFFEIVSISADTSMVVSGLTIPAVSAGASFYSAQRDGLTYKQNNISVQYTEHPTFLFGNETIISNYIGDVASFIDWEGYTFLLPNNVFGEDVIGNRIGNNFRNNTFNSDVEHNVIGDLFEYNTIYNDEDFTDNQIASNFRYNLIICDNFNDNVIGDNCNNNKIFNNIDFVDNQIGVGFSDNTIYDDFEDNKIGNGFDNNVIGNEFNDNSIGNEFNNNEIFSRFYDNLIANEFNNNTVYSDFYKNQILDNFNDNVIGDFANYGNFDFYRNYIRNNFNENVIRQDFQNNQIGTNFQENEINGEFRGNTILNGFNNNTIGNYFGLNNIGNGFHNNTIDDDFYQNTIDYYFYNNVISNYFNTNKVGTYFVDNRPSNNDLFGWNDLSTVSTRTYNTLRISLNNNVGNYILGKELVMRVISTSQYFRIKFTQWTQGGNGGGFQYERQELDSNGNTTGSTVVFTKTNYGSEVDVLVPGVVELTRDSQGGLYNTITDTPPFNNQWPGPGDTEWNSIYTQSNNGERFAYNKIGNNFRNNIIGSDFGYGGGDPYGNIINDNFENNTIGQYAYNNVIGNEFKDNTVGDNFEYNTIENDFKNNTIGDSFGGNDIENYFNDNTIGISFGGNDIENIFSGNSIGNGFIGNDIENFFVGNTVVDGFEGNEIGNYFGNNGSGPGSPVQNFIFSDFKYNKIGNFFGNDTNFPSVGGGTNGDGGNVVNDGFQFNVIGDNFIYNAIDLNFTNNKIGNDFWFNVFGTNSDNNTIGNLFVGNVGEAGFPSAIGSGFVGNTIKNFTAFNQIGTGFANNETGNYFGNAGLSNYIAPNFASNKIGDYFGDDGTATAGENIINVAFYGNEIGHVFFGNTINEDLINGGDFYSNKISSNFTNNSVYANFNNNIIGSDAVNSVDFLQYIGNISTYTLTSSLTGTNNTYIGLTGATVGAGINGTFDVVVTGDVVTSVVVNSVGQYYASTDTFIIDGALIGGISVTDDVTITIDTVTEPSVYGDYNCTIFKRPDGNNRLSFYDNSDVLNIKDINQ